MKLEITELSDRVDSLQGRLATQIRDFIHNSEATNWFGKHNNKFAKIEFESSDKEMRAIVLKLSKYASSAQLNYALSMDLSCRVYWWSKALDHLREPLYFLRKSHLKLQMTETRDHIFKNDLWTANWYIEYGEKKDLS